MLATIMEVLDTTIANVALFHIRGSLSAGVDEAAWVLTSYIVANAIVIPLTGWCGAYFGRKRFFNFSILLFVASSFMAGAAPNLQTLVVFRILQGIGGGALMPMSQAILMETFPPEEQAVAMSVWGLGMMLGPVMGPIVGGWIINNYSWRWIFYINVPIGAIACFMVTVFVHDPAYIRRGIRKIDWWGLGYLAVGIGALQVMLDKGERLDWFASHLIIALGAIGGVGLLLFAIQELRTREPIVNLRVLKNRTFAVGTVFTTTVMFGMYGTYILVPLFCQQVAGYTPLLAGLVLSIQSFGTFLSILLAGRLFNKFDPRVLVAIGCVIAGIGSWDMAHFYTRIGFSNIAVPGILRGIGSGLIFIPMTTLSLGAVRKEDMGKASGLFNMVRTIGGSIGIAVRSRCSRAMPKSIRVICPRSRPLPPRRLAAFEPGGRERDYVFFAARRGPVARDGLPGSAKAGVGDGVRRRLSHYRLPVFHAESAVVRDAQAEGRHGGAHGALSRGIRARSRFRSSGYDPRLILDCRGGKNHQRSARYHRHSPLKMRLPQEGTRPHHRGVDQPGRVGLHLDRGGRALKPDYRRGQLRQGHQSGRPQPSPGLEYA
jgi:MFS transporter, DHA2 family, multidrug resistance protein